MKIDLQSIDRESFVVKSGVIAGEECYLITPQRMGVKWTQDNKYLRSVIINKAGEIFSAGFFKFMNWGENPENFPVPTEINGTTTVDKIDGSLLCVSKYKSEEIIRTRGVFNVSQHENGDEINILKSKYPEFFNEEISDEFTYLLEWVSPKQRIVLDYGPEPDLFLIGRVSHADYSLTSQLRLDSIAKVFGLKRPDTYRFNNFEDLISNVKGWRDKEGVVLYSKSGQSMWKIKGDFYLNLHRFKSNANLESVIDLFLEYGCPAYSIFEEKLTQAFDYESFIMVRPLASKVCDAHKQVLCIISGMKEFVAKIQGLTRKEQATKIIAGYGTTNRASFAFQILDGKELDKNSIKKLLFQTLKT